MRFHRHGRGIAVQQRVQFDRVGVAFPTQALGHAVHGVVTGVSGRDGLLQRLFQGLRVHVQHDVVSQVLGAGLDAIGFAVECAGAHAHRLLELVIALGVLAGFVGGHADVGVAQAQLGQQGFLHGDVVRLAKALRRQIAEQPDARVGIQALCARRVSRLPMLEVAEHVLGAVGSVGKLQGQPAWRVGRQLQQADLVEGAAGQRGQVLAGLVGELELAGRLGITAEGGGEGFAHRADFKQSVLGHRLLCVLVRDAVVKVLRLALVDHGDGQAGNALLLHQRCHAGVDDLAHVGVCHAGAGAEQ